MKRLSSLQTVLMKIVFPVFWIPLHGNPWLNLHPVTIHLNSPSEFSDKIVFMPKVRAFAFFSSHPVVDELKELARSKDLAAKSIR